MNTETTEPPDTRAGDMHSGVVEAAFNTFNPRPSLLHRDLQDALLGFTARCGHPVVLCGGRGSRTLHMLDYRLVTETWCGRTPEALEHLPASPGNLCGECFGAWVPGAREFRAEYRKPVPVTARRFEVAR